MAADTDSEQTKVTTSCGNYACKAQACDIQYCLKRNGYSEAKCTKYIDQLYECCSKFYASEGEGGKTPCCPKPKLLKLKIEQRKQERIDAKTLQ